MNRIEAAAGRLGWHWQEYLIEGALLAMFMISACICTVLIEHPHSAARTLIVDPLPRRALIGVAMGTTAIALIYSPWGKRSGAHFNPAVTLTFLWLGKITALDAVGYVVAQFAGAIAGVEIARHALGARLSDPAVAFVVTVPGPGGSALAFAAELAISFLLMWTVLSVSNGRRAPWTGVCCGVLVALYITFEAPLSGMSMNPARTFGSAYVAGVWSAGWIYFTAPLIGMRLAADLHRRLKDTSACANLRHMHERTCLFCRESATRR